MQNKFDVIVIGGGHAGIEASSAAARMGAKVALITMDKKKIGAMHCNPSVGGLGKGHLTFEISALGGIMPQLCSKTYLQAKMLNTKKGPAVQGLRLQIDKVEYQKLASQTICNYPNITVLEEEVVEIISKTNGNQTQISGIKTKNNQTFLAPTIIISTGTFLNSAIYVGKERCNPVKSLNPSSNHLSSSLEKLIDFKLGRLKTGTPPRINKDSIDFSKLEYQESHKLDYLFEFEPIQTEEKAKCYVTYTNQGTVDIIKKNMHKAGSMYAMNSSIGARYCPSFEVKVERFPSRVRHHVFVEPESLSINEIYPSGISNSMPAKVQQEFIKTIPGFENAIMTKPGFAIEYDFLQPTNLKPSLEHKQVAGLFFAGQINGTTGYEEAASQGIIAGINACLKSKDEEPFIPSRHESYIGVMLDDLTTLGVDEPYRMFTSRAERRLSLRQDNVFERLHPHAYKLGLITKELYEKSLQEKHISSTIFSYIKENWAKSELFNIFHEISLTPKLKEEAKQLILKQFSSQGWKPSQITSRVLTNLHAKVRYDGYLDREQLEIDKAKKYESLEIPKNFSYSQVHGLSIEMQEKLTRVNPKNIAQAQLIPGITPAAISLLIFRVRKSHK